MRPGYLGIGSDVGDRRANLQAAAEDLWAHDVAVLAASSVYEAEPVGEVTDQRDFCNACVRIDAGRRTRTSSSAANSPPSAEAPVSSYSIVQSCIESSSLPLLVKN